MTAGTTARETVNLVPIRLGDSEGAPSSAPDASGLPKPAADEGEPGHGAVHASFLPGGSGAGVWTLRDAKDGVLCTLPCSYWVDLSKKHTVARSSMIQGERPLRLDVRATPFTEGAEVREQIRGPNGSRVGGIALTVAGGALTILGVVLIAAAPKSPQQVLGGFSVPNTTGVLDEELGATSIVGGVLALASGIVLTVISDGWHIEEKAVPKSAASLKLTEQGLEWAAGGLHAWVSGAGVRGVF